MAAEGPTNVLIKLAALPEVVPNGLLNRSRAWPLGARQWAAAAIFGSVLFPLRLVAILTTLLLLFVASSIVIVLGDLCGARCRRFWARLLVAPLLRFLCLCAGLWITEEGAPPQKGAANLVVANHVSGLWDAVYLLWRMGIPTLFAEQKNLKGLVGIVCRASGIVGFDRDNPGATRQKMAAAAADPAQPQVLVFPEGCCSNGTTVLQFKTGAFSPGLPVAPVALRFPVGPTGLDVSFAGPGPGIPILFLRMLAAPWTPMHVTWLPPVRPATPPPAGGELGEADAAAFAKCARKAIADSLGVTLSTFGLDDVGMEMAAQQTKMKPEDAIVELETLRELVRVRPVEAKRIVKMFAQVQQEGTVDFQQFAKLLLDIRKAEKMQEAANTEEKRAAATPVSDIAPTPSDALRLAATEPPPSLPPSSPRAAQLEQQFLRKLFDVFDVHHTGKLHLRELLVGLALLDDRGLGGQPDEHQELLRVAFQLLDEDGRGRVNAERFARVFHFLLPTLAEERYAELFAVAAAGGTEITEEKFLVWARQPEVFPAVLKLRERLFGLRQGDWLLFLDPSKSAAEGKLRTGKGGGAPKRN